MADDDGSSFPVRVVVLGQEEIQQSVDMVGDVFILHVGLHLVRSGLHRAAVYVAAADPLSLCRASIDFPLCFLTETRWKSWSWNEAHYLVARPVVGACLFAHTRRRRQLSRSRRGVVGGEGKRTLALEKVRVLEGGGSFYARPRSLVLRKQRVHPISETVRNERTLDWD